MNPQIELTQERSEELAQQIELMKLTLLQIDVPYLKALSEAFVEQASREDTLSILSSQRYDHTRSALLREQANAMKTILKLIRSLQTCDEIKRKIERHKLAFSQIDKLFIP